MTLRKEGAGPFFKVQDGRPLTRGRFVSEVKQALSRAGVNCDGYSGHSFRSGAATTAAERGIEDSIIKMLGRWKSSAYQLYVKRRCKSSTPTTRMLKIYISTFLNLASCSKQSFTVLLCCLVFQCLCPDHAVSLLAIPG